MRLIDADALMADIEITIENSGCVNHEKEILECIDFAPIVDQMKRGRWVCNQNESKFSLVCSVCGQVMPFVPEYLPDKPPFCNCGAKMEE